MGHDFGLGTQRHGLTGVARGPHPMVYVLESNSHKGGGLKRPTISAPFQLCWQGDKISLPRQDLSLQQ